MTSVLDVDDAGEVYSAALEPRPRTVARRLLLGALDLWCAQTGGRMELSRAADVVVRRRHDGVAELRLPVPVVDDAATWLAMVREDLQVLDPSEFREAWRID
ncbi:hypothetical protein GCM10009623_24820 [Nocardioides aestuarii]|uniref:WCX domain-containing protein n=1 Tax=Nocardioides aestuarii TaxID=252231 RepID=A0ABW4TQ50_9ACTN